MRKSGERHLSTTPTAARVVPESIVRRIAFNIVVIVPVRTSAAHTSKIDYSLAATLAAGHLSGLPATRLTLSVGADASASHTLRFLAGGDGTPFERSATIASTELKDPVANGRAALRKVSWGDAAEWSHQPYRYADRTMDMARLDHDVTALAISGYILYNAVVDKLSGGRKSTDALARIMLAPGTVQLALGASSTQVIPAAMFYDHPLDTQADHKLCDAIRVALKSGRALETTACFQGACPSQAGPDALRTVCPSGFWGFRHALGLPVSMAEGDVPAEIRLRGSPQIVVGVATNLDRLTRHMEILRGLRADLGWRYAATRATILAELKNAQPDVVYFYCHGGTANNVPYLQVGSGEYIEGSNLRAHKVDWSASHPLIFINGCHTTAVDPEQVINFVQDFVGIGGVGVIGTEVTVFEPLACDFAEVLLGEFLRTDVSIGAAVRSARLRLLAQGNPLGLAYTPFVLPGLRLVPIANHVGDEPLRS